MLTTWGRVQAGREGQTWLGAQLEHKVPLPRWRALGLKGATGGLVPRSSEKVLRLDAPRAGLVCQQPLVRPRPVQDPGFLPFCLVAHGNVSQYGERSHRGGKMLAEVPGQEDHSLMTR